MYFQWNGAHSPPSETLRTWVHEQRGTCFLSSETSVSGVVGCEGWPAGQAARGSLLECLLSGTGFPPPSRGPSVGPVDASPQNDV